MCELSVCPKYLRRLFRGLLNVSGEDAVLATTVRSLPVLISQPVPYLGGKAARDRMLTARGATRPLGTQGWELDRNSWSNNAWGKHACAGAVATHAAREARSLQRAGALCKVGRGLVKSGGQKHLTDCSFSIHMCFCLTKSQTVLQQRGGGQPGQSNAVLQPKLAALPDAVGPPPGAAKKHRWQIQTPLGGLCRLIWVS